MIYLDSAATTPMDPDVFEAMKPVLQSRFANPSSLHEPAQKVRKKLESVRDEIADWLDCQTRETYFTSGGTESNNLAIFGLARALEDRGNHVICSKIEHKSILNPVRQLKTNGFDVSEIPVNEDGVLSLSRLEEELRSDTVLVSVMMANNETGVRQPINRISSRLDDRDVLLHTDAAQGLTFREDVSVHELEVDAMTISGHKLHGPKGVGALYVRQGETPVPRQYGGDQEFGLRAGTENVPGIVGMGRAIKRCRSQAADAESFVRTLRDQFVEILRDELPEVHVNTPIDNSVPHILNITFPDVEGETLVFLLDQEGICASTGAACESDEPEPSHVLREIGLSREDARSSLRFSFSRMNTKEEVHQAARTTAEAYRKSQQL